MNTKKGNEKEKTITEEKERKRNEQNKKINLIVDSKSFFLCVFCKMSFEESASGRGYTARSSLTQNGGEGSYGTRGVSSQPSSGVKDNRFEEAANRVMKDIRELTRRLALIQSQVNMVRNFCE
jgi:hypothetical protein